ncbi:MAG: glutathione peroxidase [candidate division KSB1 bacterium]|nr:glutathione peroxidase [candidate division KSB1 bacterium]
MTFQINANEANSPLDFTVQSIDGESVDLAQYKGNVVLIVNTASKCGFTPQYDGLQDLYETYKDSGFTVLGFPANNFANQEPGSNEQIQEFCSAEFGVTFPMFAKISVKGEDQALLYQYLTDKSMHDHGGAIKWNFTKFLIGRDGSVVDRFAPTVKPSGKKIKTAIEQQLAVNEQR